MWLRLTDDTVTVDARAYIASQPVEYEQVEDVIDQVRMLGRPVQARIDISCVRLRDVNIIGVVRIIWELHEHTVDEPLLNNIVFIGASPRVLTLWNVLQTLLPEFVVDLVRFQSFCHESDEDEWNENEDHEA
jgi:hypothetical protein